MPTGRNPAACTSSQGTYQGMKPMALRPGAAAFHCLTALKSRSSNNAWQRSTIACTGETAFMVGTPLLVGPGGLAFFEEGRQALVGVVRAHQPFEVQAFEFGEA